MSTLKVALRSVATGLTSEVYEVILVENGQPLPPDTPPTPPQEDMVSLLDVSTYVSPDDIAGWPITRHITSIAMQPSGRADDGLTFRFDKPLPEEWKWRSNPNNPNDNYQYTVWAMARVDGRWSAAAFIQMWQGRVATGAPMLTDFHKNWAYSSQWGPLNLYLPQVGDVMGFFVSAGNGRLQRGVTSVRERSNVVTVALPPGDTGVFTF